MESDLRKTLPDTGHSMVVYVTGHWENGAGIEFVRGFENIKVCFQDERDICRSDYRDSSNN